MALVTKVSKSLHLVDASPKRENLADSQMELSPDAYYKSEKLYSVLQASNRMVRFVVLDVELCHETQGGVDDTGVGPLYEGPASETSKFALADVQVARESDFGSNDEIFNCVSHLGNLLRPGDVVLGYDMTATVGGDWEMEKSFHNNFVPPDVVLVKKVAGSPEQQDNQKSEPQGGGMTKKKERRRRRYEGKKSKELEESAVRMGFFEKENDGGGAADFDQELENDPELAEELAALEQNFAALGEMDDETPEPNPLAGAEESQHEGDIEESHPEGETEESHPEEEK
jgi:hypothetical protein